MSFALTPTQIVAPQGAIIIWILYDHPRDLPELYVLRAQFTAIEPFDGMERFGTVIENTGSSVIIASLDYWASENADALRELVPQGSTRIGRAEQDEPTILDVWIQ